MVVPVLNEEESLVELHAQLTAGLAGRAYELIFVDDGSTDGSMRALRHLWTHDNHVRVVRLRRNFGKTAALSAGFGLAQGTAVVTIDADLQDDPAEVPRLLDELENGFHLVSGWRSARRDAISKRLPSAIFNWTVKLLTGVTLHDFNCGLKAYRCEVLNEIKLYGDLHRFIPVLAHRRGFLVGELPVNHRPRPYGHSKYGVRRLLGGFLDLLKVLFLTRYGYHPLRLFGSAGLLLLAIGIALGIYLTVVWAGGESIGRRPLLTLCVLLVVAGLQLISTGLVGEMVQHATFSATGEYAVAETLV